MSGENYNPTETTAKRAAELWKRMLSSPKFDNGDESVNGAFAQSMVRMIPTNTNDELLEAFAEELTKRILETEEGGYCRNTSLHVDYGPDLVLSESAEKVGLKCQFPWKTSMRVYGDHVSVGYGYGAEWVNHYLLENGNWLITNLVGSEVERIKDFVVNGTPLEFKVEASAVQAETIKEPD